MNQFDNHSLDRQDHIPLLTSLHYLFGWSALRVLFLNILVLVLSLFLTELLLLPVRHLTLLVDQLQLLVLVHFFQLFHLPCFFLAEDLVPDPFPLVLWKSLTWNHRFVRFLFLLSDIREDFSELFRDCLRLVRPQLKSLHFLFRTRRHTRLPHHHISQSLPSLYFDSFEELKSYWTW